jgi:GNAT superfamily N-acetyltransferase
MEPRIRFAQPADADLIEQIENEADRLLTDRLAPEQWPAAPSGHDRLAQPGFLLVIEVQNGDIAGFAHVLEVDTVCHLEQLSVRPEHSRRGLGRQLLDAAREHAQERGHERISLRTYADVPWNAPFYERVGFAEEDPATDFHESLVDAEAQLGLDRYGRRVQMAAPLEIGRPSADRPSGTRRGLARAVDLSR